MRRHASLKARGPEERNLDREPSGSQFAETPTPHESGVRHDRALLFAHLSPSARRMSENPVEARRAVSGRA
jgi:hypothetical protein